LKWIAVILGVLLIAGVALGIAFVATDGFHGRINTLTVQIGKESYSNSAEGMILNSGMEIKVKSMTGSPYEYRIEASDKADFAFKVAGESGYRWSYLAGEDITKYFKIEETESGFKVFHNGLYEIIAGIYPDAVCEGAVEKGDYCTLIITCGKQERRFGFYPEAGERPSDIVIDSPDIVFGGGMTVGETVNPPKGEESEIEEYEIKIESLNKTHWSSYILVFDDLANIPKTSKAGNRTTFKVKATVHEDAADEYLYIEKIEVSFSNESNLNYFIGEDYSPHYGDDPMRSFAFVMPSAEILARNDGYITLRFYIADIPDSFWD